MPSLYLNTKDIKSEGTMLHAFLTLSLDEDEWQSSSANPYIWYSLHLIFQYKFYKVYYILGCDAMEFGTRFL